jgi:hypothetical protein
MKSANLIDILSRAGCVTRLITLRCQGCSEYLLCFAFTIMHFTIIPLMPRVLQSWLTSAFGESLAVAGSRLFRGGYISTLLSPAVNARLTWRMQSLLIYAAVATQ